MKLLKTLCLFITGLILISGCSTGGPAYSNYVKTIHSPADGNGRIWFYRPSKMGGGVQAVVMVNSTVAGKAQAGCFFFLDRKAGDYQIYTSSDWKMRIPLHLNAGEEKYVRLGLESGFISSIVPKEVSQAEGLKAIEHCDLLTADGANANLSVK